MEKMFLVTRTFKVLGCPSGDFTYTTSAYRDRNEAIKFITYPSKYFTVRRLGKNEWVEIPNSDIVSSVTEISISEINVY